MHTIRFIARGTVCEVCTPNHASLSGICSALEKANIYFKVYNFSGYLEQGEIGFGGFIYWLGKEAKFS